MSGKSIRTIGNERKKNRNLQLAKSYLDNLYCVGSLEDNGVKLPILSSGLVHEA